MHVVVSLFLFIFVNNIHYYEKLAILDEYLVDHCWTVTCHHHLDCPQLIAREPTTV